MTMNKKQLRDILLLQNEKIIEEEFLIERELLKKIMEFENTTLANFLDKAGSG